MAMIKDRLNNRPHRLIILAAVAFTRMVEHLLVDKRSKDAIDIAERFADGFATIEDVKVAEEAAEAAAWAASASAASAEAAAEAAAWAATASWAATAAAWAATASWAATAVTTRASSASESESWGLSESTSHLILDCILPTRIKVSFPIHVKGLANTIYDKKDFGLMLILADALEEMGQVDMALHCRCPIHVKGCWVLDSIMGK